MREAEAKKSGRVNASSNFVSPVIKDLPLKGTKNERSKSETNWIRGKSTDQAVKTRDAKGKSLLNKSKAKKGAAGKPIAPQEPIRSFFTLLENNANQGRRSGGATSAPPALSGVTIPVPDSDDDIDDKTLVDTTHPKMSYYGHALKTIPCQSQSIAITHMDTPSKAAAKDPLQPLNTALDYYSDTPMNTQCGPCHISPGTSDVKTVLRPGSPNHEPLQHDGNPSCEVANDTEALCEIDLCEDEWQSIFEEPLALQFEEWNDKQKEEALNEALRNLTSHPKMMQVPHVFVFAARPSGIKLSLPENFWVLTTHAQDVSFALNFRQQHPGCMAISLEKHLGPITRLVNAHIPTYCLQFFGNKSAVPVLARGISEYSPQLIKHLRTIDCVGHICVGKRTHHIIASGLQQSPDANTRIGNLTRDWNIIAAKPKHVDLVSVDFISLPVRYGFLADTSNPYALRTGGDRRSTEVISYQSYNSSTCNPNAYQWALQFALATSRTSETFGISLHQAYEGIDSQELTQDLVVFVVRKHAYDVTQVCDFLRSQGIPVAPFIGYLAAQITPEAFETLRLTANEQGVVFPSSCQDGAYRIVIKDRCAKLVHPGATVDTTLQFAYHEPTPIDFYTGFTTLEWLCTYASGHHFRAVTVQDASSQQHSTALWFDVPRAYAEDLLAKGPHHVTVGSWTATIRWPQTLSELGKQKNRKNSLETPAQHWEHFKPPQDLVSGSRVPVVIVPDPAKLSPFQRSCLNASCITLTSDHASIQALFLEAPISILAMPSGTEQLEEAVLARIHWPTQSKLPWMHGKLASAQVPSPDTKIICKFHVEGSNKIALFHESTFVHIGWHQGGAMYVSGCFGQVISLLPESVQQQCYICCSDTAVVQPAAATTYASTHNATQEPVNAQPLSPLKPDEQQGKEKLPDLRHLYVALRVLAYGAWRLTDSTEHPRQILLECVADGVPIGHCDASLTPNVVSDAVASLPDIADKGTVELINKLLALMPIGYVQHLTGVNASNQRFRQH